MNFEFQLQERVALVNLKIALQNAAYVQTKANHRTLQKKEKWGLVLCSPLLTSQALGIPQNLKGNEVETANGEREPKNAPKHFILT